jgi:hypothetical protein
MATVTKNFRIKSGLIVEGTTGTINGQNILTETGGNAYILNLVGGATLVKSVDAGTFAVDGAGNLTVKPNTFDAYGSASAAQSAAIATASADATSKANAARSAAEATASSDATTKVAAEAALRVSGDAASVSTAAADATSKVAAEAALRVSGDAASVATAAADATSKANAAQSAAEATAAAALSTAIATEVSNRNTAIGTAVDSLVDGAPALLNTLNELAAAINDDANYTTTITTALGTKANAADVTASLATAASNAAADATSKANAAQAAAISAAASDATTKANAAAATAAADATSKANAAKTAAEATAAADATSKANAAQAAAEATAAAANTAQQAGTTAFTALNVNDLVLQKASQILAVNAGDRVSAFTWNRSDGASAKLIVKLATATHTQISEIFVSLDASNNVAMTEYATVGTNGDLGETTVVHRANGQCNVDVTVINASTTVTVIATLIK